MYQDLPGQHTDQYCKLRTSAAANPFAGTQAELNLMEGTHRVWRVGEAIACVHILLCWWSFKSRTHIDDSLKIQVVCAYIDWLVGVASL